MLLKLPQFFALKETINLKMHVNNFISTTVFSHSVSLHSYVLRAHCGYRIVVSIVEDIREIEVRDFVLKELIIELESCKVVNKI